MEARSWLIPSYPSRERDIIGIDAHIHSDKAEVSLREKLKRNQQRKNKIVQQQPQQCFNQRIEKEC